MPYLKHLAALVVSQTLVKHQIFKEYSFWAYPFRQHVVTILPPFFHLPYLCALTCPQFPCHRPTCCCHVPPDYRTYSCLHCTYMYYPIRPCSCLVPYGCAMASYHISLTRLSLTHLSPLVLYTFPIGYASWSTLCSTFIRGLILFFLIQYYCYC